MAYSSSAVVLSDKERFVNFFRTAPSDASFVPAIVSLLQTYGWTRMVVITQDQNLFTDVGVNAFVWNIVNLCVFLYTTIRSNLSCPILNSIGPNFHGIHMHGQVATFNIILIAMHASYNFTDI